MHIDNCITVRQACDRLKVTDGRVRQLCLRGTFPGARRVGPIWLIPAAEVEEYGRTRRPPGNPGFVRGPSSAFSGLV